MSGVDPAPRCASLAQTRRHKGCLADFMLQTRAPMQDAALLLQPMSGYMNQVTQRCRTLVLMEALHEAFGVHKPLRRRRCIELSIGMGCR